MQGYIAGYIAPPTPSPCDGVRLFYPLLLVQLLVNSSIISFNSVKRVQTMRLNVCRGLD